MGLFGFGKKKRQSEEAAEAAAEENDKADEAISETAEAPAGGIQETILPEPSDEYDGRGDEHGPWDVDDENVPDYDEYLDMGAYYLPFLQGIELRVKANRATQQVLGTTITYGSSSVEIEAFAAPKTMGLWDDVRADLVEANKDAKETDGVFGTELTLPGVVFVVMFVITSDLHLTIGVSAALAVLQVIVRLCQRQSVMGAVSGLLAVGICLIWAWNSHEARNYYMFGFLTNAFYIVLLAISLMVRVPGLGLVIEFIRTLPTEHLRAWLADWRGDKALNRAYTIITALWIGVFSLRLVVQVPLYLSNQVGWLGTARLLMGIPFWALAIWVSYLIVATPMHRHKTLAEPNADAMDDNNETEEQH